MAYDEDTERPIFVDEKSGMSQSAPPALERARGDWVVGVMIEALTLIQTGKISRPLPLVLFGGSYWNRVLNLDAMVEEGTISPGDTDLFMVTDSVDEAFEYVVSRLTAIEQDEEG